MLLYYKFVAVEGRCAIFYISNGNLTVEFTHCVFEMEKIMDNRVDVQISLKPVARRGAIHGDDPARAGVDSRLNARARILDDDAFPGRESQSARRRCSTI